MIDTLHKVLIVLQVTLPVLIAAIALSGISLFVLWNQNNEQSNQVHRLQGAITDQRAIIQDQAQRVTTSNTLFCAQSKFLAAVIGSSLANPSPTSNPNAVAEIRQELSDLNNAIRVSGC